ncbi:hypothetical protein CBR_g6687 [Chara braunii]|uniref:4-alpha-glucanotransferase n=1 Tax=Chara braunii TaxID=69332 RepID=A0A388KKH8_CHABU|nr:hypothetical protein CBR_g6687 [Chara braunii]|eukprot:GBG70561.1 hypothetical protein CBR_g6687 [Chara braunii]
MMEIMSWRIRRGFVLVVSRVFSPPLGVRRGRESFPRGWANPSATGKATAREGGGGGGGGGGGDPCCWGCGQGRESGRGNGTIMEVADGLGPLFGEWDAQRGISMDPRHEGDELMWHAHVEIDEGAETYFEYSYCVIDEERNVLRKEVVGPRRLRLPRGLPDSASCEVMDYWQDGSSPEVLLSREAFQRVILGPTEFDYVDEEEMRAEDPRLDTFQFNQRESVIVRFTTKCSYLEEGQEVYVQGNSAALGNWESHHLGVRLHRVTQFEYEAYVIVPLQDFPITYKYMLKVGNAERFQERGPDRRLDLDLQPGFRVVIVADSHIRAMCWRGAGVAVPVFSLRTDEGVGVGEFLDLMPLIDFAAKTGMRLVQILPVNDTSVHGMWWDSYPYSSLSVFALHPLYLRLQKLTTDFPDDIWLELERERSELNQLRDVDYEAVMAVKLAIAKKIFLREQKAFLSSEHFRVFFNENKGWLEPYAAFCFLRDLFGTSDHTQWGKLSHFSRSILERLVSPESDHYTSIAFSYYLQYHLHYQLMEVSDHARACRVVLKGDLPIGVDRHSVDTWVHPKLFRMDTSTGAPPDFFDERGQNWGFPTYNWEEMARDNYRWWQDRLGQMSKYFTAYRIDHVLGFFRIWELPSHTTTGKLGRFRPAYPLTQSELEVEGLWDFEKLSKPYVRSHVLKDIFGTRWNEVAARYFHEYAPSCYEFRDDYNTEQKIASALRCKENSPDWLEKELAQTKEGLLELLQNVVLIRDTDNSRAFHPTFNMENTRSFRDLDEHSKQVLLSKHTNYFYHRQDNLWRENALKTLPQLIDASRMLPCVEDLGMIPACVKPVLNELGLLGLRIQRMLGGPGREFGIPVEYEYATVCSPSCHDTSTMRGWWEEDEGRRQRYHVKVLDKSLPCPAKCTPEISRAIIQQHLDSPSIWAVFPIQDLMALREEYARRPAQEETVNNPRNNRHYWKYRVHVTMDTLLEDHSLVTQLQDMILTSKRCSAAGMPANGHIADPRLLD